MRSVDLNPVFFISSPTFLRASTVDFLKLAIDDKSDIELPVENFPNGAGRPAM
jgi:hypothetical protein